MNFSRKDEGDKTVLKVEGSLDAVSTADLRPVIDALVSERRNNIEIDLSSLRLIDSSGVGAIVALYKRVRAQGGQVKISGIRDQPLAIFKLLRLDRVFSI